MGLNGLQIHRIAGIVALPMRNAARSLLRRRKSLLLYSRPKLLNHIGISLYAM